MTERYTEEEKKKAEEIAEKLKTLELEEVSKLYWIVKGIELARA